MNPTYLVKDHLITSLGMGTDVNWKRIKDAETGIEKFHKSFGPFPLGHISQIQNNNNSKISRFELLVQQILEEAMLSESLCKDPNTLFILSTTKANAELIKSNSHDYERLSMNYVIEALKQKFGFQQTKIISNACISGVLAVILAQRLLQKGDYKHAIILGVDVISPFIYSGFQSLNAMSHEVCRPFDISRNGISLGDGAALMVLSTTTNEHSPFPKIVFEAGAITNDANHISGPSRTGVPLSMAIQQSLQTANISADKIDFICAHGTATTFNDEMEAKAFSMSGLSNNLVFSLKGNIGHTLGAAGVAELIICGRCLCENTLVPSRGFSKNGVSVPINISQKTVYQPMQYALKTASGFGGCNASIIIKKEN